MAAPSRTMEGTSARTMTLTVTEETQRLSSDLKVSNIPISESNTVEVDTTVNTGIVVASAAVPSTVENGERLSSDLKVSNIPISESNTVEVDTTVNTGIVVASEAVPSTVENGESSCMGACVCSSLELVVDSKSMLPVGHREKLEELKVALKKTLTIERERGRLDNMSIDKCNTSFIETSYPNFFNGIFSWPMIIPIRNASQSTSDIKTKCRTDDRLHLDRISDIAEQKTFQTLLAMLESIDRPSFTICQYEWKQLLPNVVEIFTKSNDVKEGKNDILLLLPSKGVLVIEVKSEKITKKETNLENDVKYCFQQCEKCIKFVACSTLDITANKRFSYVKIASFPNISREDIKRMTCQKCSQHFITEDDLQSVSTLSAWFHKIIELLKDSHCEFDSEVYKSTVARIIGPLSRVKVDAIGEVINDTQEELNSLLSNHKWVTQKKKRTKELLQTPSFLWITELPDSVKKSLGQWKGLEILDVKTTNENVLYLIAGKETSHFIENMKASFQSHPNKYVQLHTETLCDVFRPNGQIFKPLVDYIKKLTLKHPQSHLSIIVDGLDFGNTDNLNERPSNWKSKTLKNVWIIQNPACKISPELSNLVRPGFNTVRLKSVNNSSYSVMDVIYERLHKSDSRVAVQQFQIECLCSHISKWVQLTTAQRKTAFRNKRFLWITGTPGSGKTLLAQWKIQQILKSAENEKNVIYLIAGNEDLLLIKNMTNWCQSGLLENRENVKIEVKSLEDVWVSNFYTFKGLLNVIKELTLRHSESYVSIIVDEFWLADNIIPQQMDWEKENLKNVWIIKNPACKITPDTSSLGLLGFHTENLKSIVRLSESNVNFLNEWLNTAYEVGHAFLGLRPLLFKMECICENIQAGHGRSCTPFLITKLTEEALRKLQTIFKGNVTINISEEVVIITKLHAEVNKLLKRKRLEVIVRPALFFTGCEKKVVIIDVRNVEDSGDYESILTEALTRATGIIVLFDVSCKNNKQHKQEGLINNLLQRLRDVSEKTLERQPTVKLNETEKNVLQREIDLDLYRKEQYIQQNMGSLITREMLQEATTQTIKAVEENIAKVQGDFHETISQTFTPLEKRLEKTQSDVSEIRNDLSDMKGILQSRWACQLV